MSTRVNDPREALADGFEACIKKINKCFYGMERVKERELSLNLISTQFAYDKLTCREHACRLY